MMHEREKSGLAVVAMGALRNERPYCDGLAPLSVHDGLKN
jgi:hypothetical protein